jgi:hypothetical protein
MTNATPVAVTPRRKRLFIATPVRELPMTANLTDAAASFGTLGITACPHHR